MNQHLGFGHDPQQYALDLLVAERDALAAENVKLRRRMRRLNVGAGIILAVMILSLGMTLANGAG